METENIHEKFMRQALLEAEKALKNGEVPIGAVIVSNNRIIARGYNQTEQLNDVTAHAEIIAITSATNFLGSKYLKNCSLYVTIEPCVMCAGAIAWAQIPNLIFGAFDSKKGFYLFNKAILNSKVNIINGILKNECSKIIKDFFEKKRKN
ncbi:MAG: nucleoside deaminase [Bacteroidales bacterium]|jgi:tRNA(adenine34) deaminase|nr:nucleoside deaminase [Bacteroidales bacterium]